MPSKTPADYSKTPADYVAELRAQAIATPAGSHRDHLHWLIGEWEKLEACTPAPSAVRLRRKMARDQRRPHQLLH